MRSGEEERERGGRAWESEKVREWREGWVGGGSEGRRDGGRFRLGSRDSSTDCEKALRSKQE